MLHPSRSLPVLSHGDAAEVLGEPVHSVTPIGQGVRSRVYRVETEAGAVRVLRLTPRGSGRPEREAWVRAVIGRDADLPTLAELRVTNASVARTADVVSMAELPGATLLAATRTLFEPETCAHYERFGAALGALHGRRVQGFGLLDGAGRGAYATWPAAFDALAHAALDEARVSPLADLVPAAEAALAAGRLQLDPAQPAQLLHGDAQPTNVQVHRGRIIAVFDFEFASGGDAAYELAYLEPLFETSFDQPVHPDALAARRAAFYTGYARRGGTECAPGRTRLYRLVHALRGTEFLSVVGPQLAGPAMKTASTAMRAAVERWL